MVSPPHLVYIACFCCLVLTALAHFLISFRNELLAMSNSSSKTMPVYSLWLSPSATCRASSIFSSLISSLPGPVFPPHATLLGSAPRGMSLEQVKAKLEDAVDDWKRLDAKAAAAVSEKEGKSGLTVPFEDVRTGDEFFRCVLVKLRDSSSLHALHHHVLGHLPSPSERQIYYPHISLLYSNISLSARQSIVDDLYSSRRARQRKAEGGPVVSMFADGEDASEVRFDRISIVQTKGVAVEDWAPAGEVMI